MLETNETLSEVMNATRVQKFNLDHDFLVLLLRANIIHTPQANLLSFVEGKMRSALDLNVSWDDNNDDCPFQPIINR